MEIFTSTETIVISHAKSVRILPITSQTLKLKASGLEFQHAHSRVTKK